MGKTHSKSSTTWHGRGTVWYVWSSRNTAATLFPWRMLQSCTRVRARANVMCAAATSSSVTSERLSDLLYWLRLDRRTIAHQLHVTCFSVPDHVPREPIIYVFFRQLHKVNPLLEAVCVHVSYLPLHVTVFRLIWYEECKRKLLAKCVTKYASCCLRRF
jgi:hypothetical protein